MAGMLCLLPRAMLFNGYRGRQGEQVFVVKVHTDYIGFNAVTPVLNTIVYQWEILKGNWIKYLYLSGCIHDELNFFKRNKELLAVF